MNGVDFLTAAAHAGATGRTGPLPMLSSTDLWPHVLDLAIEHRVGPLIHEALSRSSSADVPSKVRAALEGEALRSEATRLLCESVLADAVGKLRRDGVEVIVLKGASVAHDVYPRPELRLYHDVDVLCRVADYPKLYETLLAHGYTSAGTHEARGSHAVLAAKPSPAESHAVRAFYDPSGDTKIEVHFDIFQLGLCDRNADAFWRRARKRTVGGASINMLGAEDQFLHLAFHAHRHCYSRLSWLIELDLCARQTAPALDWEVLTRRAREEGIGTPLRHAVATMAAILGTPRPALPPPTLEERCLSGVYHLLWPIEKARALKQREFHRLLHFLPDDPDARNVLYGLVLVGRRSEKVRAIRSRPRWPLPRRPCDEVPEEA
jgi:hypothetical protein